jgi:ATP-dependent protease HslVU (ClpYQ) peptidase subunit
MTCIAAVVHDSKVYLGGDSAGANNWEIDTRADAKVFVLGEFLMGFTDSFRMGQLLRYTFTPPALPDTENSDLFRYMVAEFVEATRECLKKGGYAKKENEREEGGTFLVGIRGHIFDICSDYQVEETADGYNAVGSGRAYAKGALFASTGLPPEKRIRMALKAAERHTPGVRGPFVILGPDGQRLDG